MGANVVVVPYKEGREKLFAAMLKRRKTEDRLRAEETELEKLADPNAARGPLTGNDPSPNTGASARQTAQGAKTTLGHLADRALIYFEEVSQRKDPTVTPQRLAEFRKKLGINEIKEAASRISSRSNEDSEKAIREIREILQRDVYSGTAIVQDRNLALETLKTLELSFQNAPTATPVFTANNVGEKLSGENLRDRLISIEITRMQTRDPVQMFTALPNAHVKAKTDSAGRCSLTIPSEGRWLIGVSRQQERGVIAEALGISKSDCWIQEIESGVTQLDFTEDNALRPAVAPLGLEQETPWK